MARRLIENHVASFLKEDGLCTDKVAIFKAATATTAGGVQALGLGTTTGLGIYFGSGAPTISAAQGSLYVRTDGSSVATRLYVNTTGSTTWTNVTTAA